MPRTRFSPLSSSVARRSFGIGADEVGRRERGAHLPQIELRLVAVVRLDVVGATHEIVGPARHQHVGLLDEVEERIVAPLRVGETLVRLVGLNDGRRLPALKALQGRGPEIDELGGQRGLRLEGALRIGEVIFRDLAERARHLSDVVGERRLERPVLARPQVGGEHLPRLLERAGHIVGEGFDIRRRIGGAESGAGGRFGLAGLDLDLFDGGRLAGSAFAASTRGASLVTGGGTVRLSAGGADGASMTVALGGRSATAAPRADRLFAGFGASAAGGRRGRLLWRALRRGRRGLRARLLLGRLGRRSRGRGNNPERGRAGFDVRSSKPR